MLPAVAASQRSRWAAAREAGREGESSGPGPAPAGEQQRRGGGFYEWILFPSFRAVELGLIVPGSWVRLKEAPKLFFFGGVSSDKSRGDGLKLGI